MTPSKRLFDFFTSIILSIILFPLILLTALAIYIFDGAPLFYVSERMRTSTQCFRLVKFRTMRSSPQNDGVSGGDKAARITRTGKFLRRSRLDEIPQLWNVLKGDISFVGPRPPLRRYVEKFPEVYKAVLLSRPGITGLASVYYHAHEELLLSRCRTAEETDAIYSRSCIPRKARIDLIYQSRRNLCFDFVIMLSTVFRRLR